LESVTIPVLERIFADVVKDKNVEMGRIFWMIWLGPECME
jgi:hypothetical protein